MKNKSTSLKSIRNLQSRNEARSQYIGTKSPSLEKQVAKSPQFKLDFSKLGFATQQQYAFQRSAMKVDEYKGQKKGLQEWTQIRSSYELDIQQFWTSRNESEQLSRVLSESKGFANPFRDKPLFSIFDKKKVTAYEKRKLAEFCSHNQENTELLKSHSDSFGQALTRMGISNVNYQPPYQKDSMNQDLKVMLSQLRVQIKAEERERITARNCFQEKVSKQEVKANKVLENELRAEYRWKSNVDDIQTSGKLSQRGQEKKLKSSMNRALMIKQFLTTAQQQVKSIQKPIRKKKIMEEIFTELRKQKIYLMNEEKARVNKIKKRLIEKLVKISKLKLDIDDVCRKKLFPTIPFEKIGSKILFEQVKLENAQRVREILLMNEDLLFDFDNNFQTPLHIAVKRGSVQIAQMILDRACDVDAIDIMGKTPLYYGVKYQKDELVQMLLSHHANPWSSTKNNYLKYYDQLNLESRIYFRKSKQIDLALRMTPKLKRQTQMKELVRLMET